MQAVELFAGAGGLGMGVSMAGFKPVKIVEWDRWCCDTINANRNRSVRPLQNWPKPEHMDARLADYSPWEDKIALVTGGPPCQPFSLGGKHRANRDGRDMWPEAVRAVREIRPKAFMFENVKGLTRSSFQTYFQYIQLQLSFPEIGMKENEDWLDHFHRLQKEETGNSYEGLHYKVVSEVLNAANFGVPQKRERVFIVGIRSDLKVKWSFPKGRFSQDALLWSQWRSEKYWERHRVPSLERTCSIRTERRAERLRGKPGEKPWRTVRDALEKIPDPLKPDHGLANHVYQPGARAYAGHTGSPLDEPAKTLKAGVHGVPGGENMMACPDGSVRYFTVRESAALQTFPDQFVLNGSWTEAMRQLGNAVPVRLAKYVASDLAELLRGAPRFSNDG